MIIDMCTCTCTIGRQKESLVFCLTHIQVLNVGTHEHDKVLTDVSMLSNLVFDKMCLHSMHEQQTDNFSNPTQTLLKFGL